MKEYPKIQSIFKRDDHGKFTDEYSVPAFEYLANNRWRWDEKCDGTNIRVIYKDGKVTFGGKSDNAQIPTKLLNTLQDLFPVKKFAQFAQFDSPVCLLVW